MGMGSVHFLSQASSVNQALVTRVVALNRRCYLEYASRIQKVTSHIKFDLQKDFLATVGMVSEGLTRYWRQSSEVDRGGDASPRRALHSKESS